MTDTSPFQWSSAANSDVGLVRQVNEDAFLDLPERRLWAVADGMGGHMLGDLASRIVIAALEEVAAPDSLSTYAAQVCQQLTSANTQLRTEATTRGAEVIGSTVVALFAHGAQCGFAWAGDSRIYLYRDGSLQRLTRDHSLVEELVACGSLSPEQALTYPGRNLITRAIGAAERLDVDTGIIDVADGDIYLLCSDGLTNEISGDDIGKALVAGDCRHAADTLVQMALQQGGYDNVSALVVRAERLS